VSALERSITLPFAGVGRQTLIIRTLSGDEMAVDGNKRTSSSEDVLTTKKWTHRAVVTVVRKV